MPRASKRGGGRAPALVVLAVSFLLPASAVARSVGGGPLSPDLRTLARPAIAAKPPAQQAQALGLPETGPGSLIREGGRVLVEAHFEAGALARLAALRQAGARILNASGRYQSDTLSLAPGALQAVAAVPGVSAVKPVPAPMVYGTETECEGGSVISEGVGQMKVDQAREVFPLRGKGMTVGVLSDSFDVATEAVTGGKIATHAAQDVASNDLPGPRGSCSDQQLPVRVLQDGPAKSADEGRAMLQIIHDVAPHASLAFATAFTGELGFAHNIELLAKPVSEGGAGADVIVDDVGYLEEPFFQDGPVAAAVNKVTSEGVTYVSAAGNDNLFDEAGHEIGSWEAPEFRDAGSCPSVIGPGEVHCMDFNPAVGVDDSFGITVEPKETLTVDLQWAEPWFGVETDIDAYLLNKGETQILEKATRDNIEEKIPVEVLEWENKSSSSQEVQLVINRCFGPLCNPKAALSSKPRLKFALLENGGGVKEVEYPTSAGGDVVGPTIFGHAGAASALSVAAIPFDSTAEPERYSSRGPVTHYFGEVAGSTASAPIPGGEVIHKPDITATDCGRTTFFAVQSSGVWRFCGTSAAAPHAAAVAALLRQGDANAKPQEIREILLNTAAPIGAFPETAVGAGLVDAASAVEHLPDLTAEEDGPSVLVSPLEEASSPAPVPSPTPVPSPAPITRRVAPSTSIVRHPPKAVRTGSRRAAARFEFASDQSAVVFFCRIDGGRWQKCPRRFRHRFKLGRHVVRVQARNGAGLVDQSPAVFRFVVRRR